MSRPPITGMFSTQFAWARASRCMNGERFELSGLNSLDRDRPVITRQERMTSMSTSRNSAQAMNSVRT